MTHSLRRAWHRLRAVVLDRQADHELADELDSHIQMQTEEYVRQGVPPDEAHRLARVKFGSVPSATESIRDLGGLPIPRWLRTVGLIVRDAARAIRRTPSHAAMVAGVLAIGITAGTVTFSVVDAVLLRPLPIEGGDRLVSIGAFDEQARKWRIDGELFWRLHDHTQTLDAVAAVRRLMGQSSSIAGLTDEFTIAAVSSDAFRILHLSAGLGRLWTAQEEAPGEIGVAVLGYRFWQRDLGGRSDVLELTVTSAHRRFRVVGVLSAASDHPEIALLNSPIWIPGAPRHEDQSVGILARVRPDRTRAMVADELRAMAAAPTWQPRVTGPLDAERERVRHWMLLALGASGVLLLLGCVNAANLMLARSAKRARELAVRASLGASNRRIAASVLAEGLLLSLAATAVALLLASWGVGLARSIFTTLPLNISQAPGIVLNGRVVVAAMASAILTGVLFSVVPVWQASPASIVELLKDGAPGASSGRSRWRLAFLVTEVAAVTVLLVVSWLFVASLVRVVTVDLGVDRSRLITVFPRVPYTGSPDDVVERVRRVPGVADVAESTGAMLSLSLSGVWVTTNVSASDAPGEPPFEVLQYRVTKNFFDVAGIEFLRGTVWVDGSSNPIVLDEIVSHRLFGDANPIGREVRASEPAGVHTVVGVVPALRTKGPEQDPQMAVYFPPNPRRRAFESLLVRTVGPGDDLVRRVTQALVSVAPAQKDSYVYSGDEAIRVRTMMRRFNAGLMSAFGLVGVLIGAAGIYAVTGSVVAQRTNEIGVRMALGATPPQIARHVLGSTFIQIGAGLALGLPIAWWLSRGFGNLLFGVTPADVSVYSGVSVLVCAIGMIAAFLPSRRAARVDPIASLRN